MLEFKVLYAVCERASGAGAIVRLVVSAEGGHCCSRAWAARFRNLQDALKGGIVAILNLKIQGLIRPGLDFSEH